VRAEVPEHLAGARERPGQLLAQPLGLAVSQQPVLAQALDRAREAPGLQQLLPERERFAPPQERREQRAASWARREAAEVALELARAERIDEVDRMLGLLGPRDQRAQLGEGASPADGSRRRRRGGSRSSWLPRVGRSV
jgi:hypothetical protein